jgi:hypothetical protein
MQETDRVKVVRLFATAIQIAQLVRPARDADDSFKERFGALWREAIDPRLRELHEALSGVPEIADIPPDVFVALRDLALIDKGTRTECISFPDVANYLALHDMEPIAIRGWQGLVRSKPDNQIIYGWADGEPPHSLGRLNEFPPTLAGHLSFIEEVRDEVHRAAEAKRNQMQERYSNDTLAGMVSGIKWQEAKLRLEALGKLSRIPTEIVAGVDAILARELTVGTIVQIDSLLSPAVDVLRDAHERGRIDGQSLSGAQLTAQHNTRKRRGRKKADYETVTREAALAASWKRAREAKVFKTDFCKTLSPPMTLKAFDALLDRVSKRKKPSEE